MIAIGRPILKSKSEESLVKQDSFFPRNLEERAVRYCDSKPSKLSINIVHVT